MAFFASAASGPFVTELRFEDKPHLTQVAGLPFSAKDNDAFEGMQGRFFSSQASAEAILQKSFAAQLLGKKGDPERIWAAPRCRDFPPKESPTRGSCIASIRDSRRCGTFVFQNARIRKNYLSSCAAWPALCVPSASIRIPIRCRFTIT